MCMFHIVKELENTLVFSSGRHLSAAHTEGACIDYELRPPCGSLHPLKADGFKMIVPF